jgi:Tol biopolymer transport system component
LSSAARESDPAFDSSGTVLVLANDFETGDTDLSVTRRSAVGAAWDTPVRIPGVNSASQDDDPWISGDTRYLIFASTRDGDGDLYECSR